MLLLLNQLLGSTMQQADMRVGAFDNLAVKLEENSRHHGRRNVAVQI
jgi:hypothetical protein